jgi:hypothetical protein
MTCGCTRRQAKKRANVAQLTLTLTLTLTQAKKRAKVAQFTAANEDADELDEMVRGAETKLSKATCSLKHWLK